MDPFSLNLAEAEPDAATARFHDIQVQGLPYVEVEREFRDVRLLASGWYTKIFLARQRFREDKLVLKCIQKGTTSKEDFFREFHYSYQLSQHPNIVKSFYSPFVTRTSYVFTQEVAPCGDLSQYLRRGGIGEAASKRVAEQVSAALAFMHSKGLVHRDVTPENILVFDSQLHVVKLSDFGSTRRTGEGEDLAAGGPVAAWTPPEVRQAGGEAICMGPWQDAWALGVLLFTCLTGRPPWSAAHISDPHYRWWAAWATHSARRPPHKFRCFTPRLLRLLRHLLHPLPEKRCVTDVAKYLSYPWLVHGADPYQAAVEDALRDPIDTQNTKPRGVTLFKAAEKKVREALRSHLCYGNTPQKTRRKTVRFDDTPEDDTPYQATGCSDKEPSPLPICRKFTPICDLSSLDFTPYDMSLPYDSEALDFIHYEDSGSSYESYEYEDSCDFTYV